MTVSVTLGPTDGLDRSAEAPALIATGRSLTESAIQQLYRDFALAVWRHLRPEHLALVAETNAIGASTPATLLCGGPPGGARCGRGPPRRRLHRQVEYSISVRVL